MDTSTLTHVAAILIGVGVTLALVKGANSDIKSTEGGTQQQQQQQATTAEGGSKKKKNKKSKAKKNAAETTNSNGNNTKENGKPTAAAPAPAPPKQEKNGGNQGESNKENKAGASKNKKKNKDNKVKGGGDATKPKEAEKPQNQNGSNNKKKDEDINVSYAGDVVVAPPEVTASYSEMVEEWNSVPVTKNKKKRPKKPTPDASATAAPAASTSTPAAAYTPVGMAPPSLAAPSAVAAETPAVVAAPAPAAPAFSDSVTVDGKKIGIIIGPKGSTMNAVQDATGCKLDINAPAKDDINNKAGSGGVVITGPDKESIAKAKKAVMELASKGYATLLQSQSDPTFGEFYKEVHPRYLSEIVGPGGRTIQAIQNGLNVKLTIPSTDWKPNMKDAAANKVKNVHVGIAGSKENAKEAKAVIQSLVKYHHHEITHPGMIHEETHVPREFFHCIIGPRGSEIKHIRGNFKVDVYMPQADDKEQENVLVVGRPLNVDRAITYIQTLMDRDVEQREKKFDDEFY